MNDQISQSEGRYRALVTATSDVVYRMSPDWRVMRQLESAGFLSDTGQPINDWMDKYIYAEDRERVQEAIRHAIETKTMFQLEHRVQLADGSIGWTFSRAVPILDGHGEIEEWFGAANDVSSRKKTEEALGAAKDLAEQQKRMYEAVTSSTPDLIYVFGLDYRFTYANEALLTMWGKSWTDAVGKGLLENGYEPWHAEMHEREIDTVAATKQAIRGEVSFPHAT
ncbi:MAG: PAS domain S-box protein, partial [Sphingobacteriales bacterium]